MSGAGAPDVHPSTPPSIGRVASLARDGRSLPGSGPTTIHTEPATIDMSRIIADQAAIRRVNPQRFEMEQLTAIVYIDPVEKICAAYKDVGSD